MRLFITEKNVVAIDIAEALDGKQEKGDGFIKVGNDIITWCTGIGKTSIEIPEIGYGTGEGQASFEELDKLQLKILNAGIQEKNSHVMKIINFIIQADEVINACDDDELGEQLFKTLLDQVGKEKNIKKISTNNLTKEVLMFAISKI